MSAAIPCLLYNKHPVCNPGKILLSGGARGHFTLTQNSLLHQAVKDQSPKGQNQEEGNTELFISHSTFRT